MARSRIPTAATTAAPAAVGEATEVATVQQQPTLRELFGVDNDTPAVVRNEDHPLIPSRQAVYAFRIDHLRKLLLWQLGVLAEPGLWLSGPTGSGKSSLVEQFAARVRLPVFRVSCTGRTTLDDLLGGLQLAPDGGMIWVDGPLGAAMRVGGILLLDEWDLVSPSESTGLNTVLDGAPVLIKATGEYVTAHPDFRVAATGNTFGWQDASHASYRGAQRQNLASLDRFAAIQVGYLEETLEVRVLVDTVPEIAPIAEVMVKTANRIRELFTSAANPTEKLSNTVSTRGLIRWARATVAFTAVAAKRKDFVASVEGMKFALLDKWPAHEAQNALVAFESFSGVKASAGS